MMIQFFEEDFRWIGRRKTEKIRVLFLYMLVLSSFRGFSQDSVRYRMIFIGDAGFRSGHQQALIADAASRIIYDKTAVVFLGDNIFPNGMSEKRKSRDESILKSQYTPMREKGASVYFLPGYRDWGKAGPDGGEKVWQQWDYLNRQADDQLKMLPPGGCPDPVVIPFSDSLVMVALNTEWWITPYNTVDTTAGCLVHTEQEAAEELRRIMTENRNKTILLAGYHPFESYGRYGGKFSWKDHLFPLTAVNPGFYLPLPVVGSLYPLFRKTFPKQEALPFPEYHGMIRDITQVFKDFPNLIVVSAHEDGLQLIKDTAEHRFQIVSGIGKKSPFTKKGKHTLYNASVPGYVMVDLTTGNNLTFTFIGYKNAVANQLFQYSWKYKNPRKIWSELFKNLDGDSATGVAYGVYDRMGKFGRFWLGKNYRKEWATPVKLPVFRISDMYGGLKVVKLGGGYQSTTIRLEDPHGKQYQLRSDLKTADRVIPKPFRVPLARKLVEDMFSSQHPYGALMVPPIAEAAGVPHAAPRFGIVAPDTAFGDNMELFAGKINMIEEREPLGNSDNFEKAFQKLREDNDNTFDAENFLRARMVDLLIGDWDRHDDQWRFYDLKRGKNKHYIAVPRDRDMAMNVTNGLLLKFAKKYLLIPHVQGFGDKLWKGSNFYLYNSSIMNFYPSYQMSHSVWEKTVQEFRTNMTDSVLETAVAGLPKELDSNRTARILKDLRIRRDDLPSVMEKYYRFSNRYIDILASEKNEFLKIEDVEGQNAVHVLMQKISKKDHLDDTLVNQVYPRSLTKEIRVYLSGGDDSVVVNTPHSDTKLRIIGGQGQKAYNIIDSRKKVRVYDSIPENYFGRIKRILKHISSDTFNLRFLPVNLYDTYMPLATGAINSDDGISVGLGVQFKQQRGFRKAPYAAIHSLTVAHSFSSSAMQIKYHGLWIELRKHLDFALDANAMTPENRQNFFGAGNNTPIDKTGDWKHFYRARFNLYNLTPAFMWHLPNGSTFSMGPTLQYYHTKEAFLAGRLTDDDSLLHSFDSSVISKDKLHLGWVMSYDLDKRDTMILPGKGYHFNIGLAGYDGVSQYAKSFGKLTTDFSVFKSLDNRHSVVLSERIGGAAIVGKPAFYQYFYLGGQGNLLGFRKYRFAGQYGLYNNLELRVNVVTFGGRVFRGRLGVTAGYDVGRVWAEGEHSSTWHNGVSGGIYLAPFSVFLIRFNMGYSSEGWYPYGGIGFRF